MRSFINWFLTIILFIIIMISICIFSLGNLTNKNSTQQIINETDSKEIVNNFKKTEEGKNIYSELATYGLDEKKVDEILNSKNAKNYSNEVLQQVINNYLTNNKINLKDQTKTFIQEINKNYNLKLSNDDVNKISDYTNETLTNKLQKEKNSDAELSSEEDLVIKAINFCKDKSTKLFLITTIMALLIILFITSFKTKNFLEYIGTISLTCGIAVTIFKFLITALIKKATISFGSVNLIISPLTNNFAQIGIISLILGIIFLIGQHFVAKGFTKEKVPF